MVSFAGVAVVAVAAACALCARAGTCASALTAAEIATNPARAVEFFGPSAAAYFGYAVGATGDINNDGFDDFVVGAPNEDSAANAGAAFLVFGRSSSAWASAQFNFSEPGTPDPASWIKISGVSGSYIGWSGFARGDFNHDGIDDLVVGTNQVGKAFCVYGRGGSWASFSLDVVESGVVPGFSISTGVTGNDLNVGNAGDMNGDGVEDILLSASTVAYVVFGVSGPTRSNFETSTIDGTNGFALSDGTNFLGSREMGNAGDVDGDGLADLVIGSGTLGYAYVLFARNMSASGQQWSASLNLTAHCDGTNSFIVDGSAFPLLGRAAKGAGDVNGDGFADILIGSGSSDGGALFVLGHPAPWTSPFNASLLDGTNGFHFSSSTGEFWGYSGGAAGDINNDGFDDILISGKNAYNSLHLSTGAAAIIFGCEACSWPAELTPNELVGSVGFLIDGPSSGSQFGISARGAGDVNGDGLADIVVGAYYLNSQAEYAALVFGIADDHCAVCSNTTDVCFVCEDGFILDDTSVCINASTAISSSSSAQQGVSVVVIIKFLEDVTDPTELQEEIASVLGIDAGLVSVVVISPTEVEVTIIGSEETAQRLVDIINNGSGSGSGLGLLRKAINAHIRKDADGSSDDGVDAASHVALCPLFVAAIAFVAAVVALPPL